MWRCRVLVSCGLHDCSELMFVAWDGPAMVYQVWGAAVGHQGGNGRGESGHFGGRGVDHQLGGLVVEVGQVFGVVYERRRLQVARGF